MAKRGVAPHLATATGATILAFLIGIGAIIPAAGAAPLAPEPASPGNQVGTATQPFSTCNASSTLQGATTSDSSSLSLAAGGCVYLYAAVNGGKNITSTTFPADFAWPVPDSGYAKYRASMPFQITGHTTADSASFTSIAGTLYYEIGGVEVSTLPTLNYSYSAVNTTTLNGSFSLAASATVVVMVTTSNDYAPEIGAPYRTLAEGNNSVVTGILIATADLGAGVHHFEINSTEWQSFGSLTAVAYVFPRISDNCTPGMALETRGASTSPSDSITLPSGACDYLYAATNGGKNITAESFSTDFAWPAPGSSYANYRGSAPFNVFGESSSDSANFSSVSGTLYPLIGGVAVSARPAQSFDFNVTNSSGLSGSFTVDSPCSVVMIAAGSNDYAPAVGAPFRTLAEGDDSVVDGILVAEANLSAGAQSFSVSSTQWQAFGSLAAIVYVFPLETALEPTTFVESGLPAGTAWGVNVSGSSLESTRASFETNLTNGVYEFGQLNVSGYRSPEESSFVVNGSAVVVAVNYLASPTPYQLLATSISSGTPAIPPTVTFTVSSESNVVILASVADFSRGAGGNATLIVDGHAVPWSTANLIPGLFGPFGSFTGAYVIGGGSGTYSAQVEETHENLPFAALSVVAVPSNTTFQFVSSTAPSQVEAELAGGMEGYLYAAASVNEPITASTPGSLLGGAYPQAPGFATSTSYYADAVEGYTASNEASVQANSAAGGGAGLNNVGITLVGIAASAGRGFVSFSGTVEPADASVVLNGVVAPVSPNGSFAVSVMPGVYDVSVTAPGYFPVGQRLALSASTVVAYTLTPEPAATSTESSGAVTAIGYNVTILTLENRTGRITVTFTAGSNAELLITVPYAAVANVTIGEILSSQVYVNGVTSTDFTITLTSTYLVTMAVSGLPADPTLVWALSPAPNSGTRSTFLGLPGEVGYYVTGAVILAIAGLSALLVVRRRRGSPPSPPARPAAPTASSTADGGTEGDDLLRDVLAPLLLRTKPSNGPPR